MGPTDHENDNQYFVAPILVVVIMTHIVIMTLRDKSTDASGSTSRVIAVVQVQVHVHVPIGFNVPLHSTKGGWSDGCTSLRNSAAVMDPPARPAELVVSAMWDLNISAYDSSSGIRHSFSPASSPARLRSAARESLELYMPAQRQEGGTKTKTIDVT